MAIAVARVAAELDQVYCPFSGQPIYSDGDVNELPSILFVYYDDAGEYAFVSDLVSGGLTGGQFREAMGPRRVTNGRGQWRYLENLFGVDLTARNQAITFDGNARSPI